MLLFGSAVVAVAATAVSFVSAAGGHGNYVAAKVFFPYSLALTHLTQVITSPLIVLALMQYPGYALGLWMARRDAFARIRWIALAAFYVAAVLLAFRFADSSFTP